MFAHSVASSDAQYPYGPPKFKHKPTLPDRRRFAFLDPWRIAGVPVTARGNQASVYTPINRHILVFKATCITHAASKSLEADRAAHATQKHHQKKVG